MEMIEKFQDLNEIAPGAKLEVVGKVPVKTSTQIARSPLSIGCETLDRDFWDWEKAFPYIKQIGPKWARVQTGWAKTEQVKGVYDFTWLDKIVDDLLSVNITPWLSCSYGNLLYAEGEPTNGSTNAVPIWNQEQRDAWQAYIAKLAAHYKGRVKYFEVWNEPDIDAFWGPKKSCPADYAKLVKLTSPVLRMHNPDAKIIAGVIAYSIRYCGFSFLDGMLKSCSPSDIDIITFHSYDPCPELLSNLEIEKLRDMLSRHGIGDIPIWQGEGGCPTVMPRNQALSGQPWNEHKQVKMLLRNAFMDLEHGATVTSYFHLYDFAYVNRKTGDRLPTYYGLLRHPDYTPKPSFHAYQALSTLLGGDVKRSVRIFPSLHKNDWEREQLSPWDAVEHDHNRQRIQRVSLERDGYPLIAWWCPANPHQPELKECERFKPFTAKMMLTSLNDGDFKDPVIVDLATQTVYRPGNTGAISHWEGFDKTLVINDVPVLDYPLVLTEAAALGL
jgi:hypothetical protein